MRRLASAMVRRSGIRTTPPADGFRTWRLASTRGVFPDTGENRCQTVRVNDGSAGSPTRLSDLDTAPAPRRAKSQTANYGTMMVLLRVYSIPSPHAAFR